MSTDMVNKDYHLHSQFAVVQRNIHLLMGNWVCPAFACIHGGPGKTAHFSTDNIEETFEMNLCSFHHNFMELAKVKTHIKFLCSCYGRQTLRRWTEGTAYIRQGDHHVGHGPHSS